MWCVRPLRSLTLFLFTFSLVVVVLVFSQELDEDGRHVVKADRASRIRCTSSEGVTARLDEVFDAFGDLLFRDLCTKLLARSHVLVECLLNHEAAGALVALLLDVVPDAIAAQNHELHIGTVDLLDVGLAANLLFKSVLVGSLLEFEIAECSGYGQLGINAPLIDEATSSLNSFLLDGVVWLVIDRKCFALTSLVGGIVVAVGGPVSGSNRT
jgi:hypothetical protein